MLLKHAKSLKAAQKVLLRNFTSAQREKSWVSNFLKFIFSRPKKKY